MSYQDFNLTSHMFHGMKLLVCKRDTFQKKQIKLSGSEVSLAVIASLWKVKQNYFLKMYHKTNEE